MRHLHILYTNSDSSAKDMWNLEQIHKVLFRCNIHVEFQICFQIFDRRTGYSALHLGMNTWFFFAWVTWTLSQPNKASRSYQFDQCCFSPSPLHSSDHKSTSNYLYLGIFTSNIYLCSLWIKDTETLMLRSSNLAWTSSRHIPGSFWSKVPIYAQRVISI